MNNAQKMELQFYMDALDLVQANWVRCNEVMEPEELAKACLLSGSCSAASLTCS